MTGFASELPPPEPTRVDVSSFLRGIAAGFALAMYAMQLWLAIRVVPAYEHIARDFGSSPTVPALFRLVVSRTWTWGVPSVGAALLAYLIVQRPRALWPYLAVAAVLVVGVVVTWLGAQSPITALASGLTE